MKPRFRMTLRVALFLTLMLAVLVPAGFALGVEKLLQGPLSRYDVPPNETAILDARSRLVTLIEGGPWTDPSFQTEMASVAAGARSDVVLISPHGKPLFATNPQIATNGGFTASTDGETRLVYVPQGAYMLLSHRLYSVSRWRLLSYVVTPLSVLAIFWLLAQSLSRPVLALTEAAQRLGAGEWDAAVPASPITEVDQLGEAFVQMRDSLQTAMTRQANMEKERRHFIAAITHDLRTPLFSIKGYIGGLLDGVAKSPEQVHKYLTVAAEKAAQLERLVSDLFLYNRLEYLEVPVRREPVAVRPLLDGALAGLRPKADARQVALVMQVDPAAPTHLQADPHLLTRVLDNLLENAIRHTPPGGTVTIAAQPGPIITVSDTGEGIAPEDLPHVFEPLYRADASRSSATGGAGLGLAIARLIMEAHGARIAVQSAPGAGTTFQLHLGG